MKTELKIDGRRCDLEDEMLAVPGYAAQKTRDPEACRDVRNLRFRNGHILGLMLIL